MAVGDGAVWVADESDGTLQRIDPSNGDITDTLDVPNHPAAVAVGEGAVWVAIPEDSTVARIEP